MKKLKELRNKYNYSCADMVKEMNVTRPFYWQLENGKRRLTYERAIQIAKVFKMRPDDIFYEEFTKK